MSTETINYKIVAASQASPEALAAFYNRFFSSRRFPLKDNWQWQNRTSYLNQQSPLVMLDGERVIAHAGIIPFQLKKGNQVYSASWYIDFMVDAEYRRKGLGIQITNAFTQLSDIYFAITGNEKSMGAFRKLGWAESKASFIHYIPLRPFHHPKLSSKLPNLAGSILNKLSYPLVYLNLFSFKPTSSIEIFPITEDTIHQLEQTDFTTDRWTPVKNMAYWKWRLLESPDAKAYRLFKIEDQYLVFKTHMLGLGKVAELLFIPNHLKEAEQLQLIGQLSFWALKNNFSYVRQYVTIPTLSEKIRRRFKSFITYPEFAFKATDTSLFKQLQHESDWDFQFIDNDFEVL